MLDENPNCSKIEALLDAFHDGELLDEEKAEVTAHLSDCQLCQRRLDEIGAVASLVGELPRLKMRQEVTRNWAAILEEHSLGEKQSAALVSQVISPPINRADGPKRGSLLQFGQRFQVLLTAAAALSLLILTGVFIQFRAINEPTTVATRSASQQQTSSIRQSNNANVASTDNTNGDLIAIYPNETAFASEELGISTDEDGLYALKL